MKKRVLALCLCLFLLLAFVACNQEEEPAPTLAPTLAQSSFYTLDGMLQNTHVKLVVNTEALVAPVTELSYTLYDFSEYGVSPNKHLMGTKCQTLLEVYRDGAWEEAPFSGGIERDVIEASYGKAFVPAEQQKIDFKMTFSGYPSDAKTLRGYAYLTPGLYRLKMKCFFYADQEKETAQDRSGFAVAYFTVTAE